MNKTLADLLAEKAVARKDPSKHTHGAPAGYVLRGVSTLTHTENGELQWVKTTREQEQAQLLLEAFREALALAPIPARAKTKAPKTLDKDLLAVYPMGDPHFGMLAWPEETGNDFNLQIAREHLTEATRRLVALMPAAEQALLINLGDMAHADGPNAMTTKGTRVDVDGRYGKMLRVIVDTLVVCINELLTKHKTVRVENVPGNHDDQTTVVMAMCLREHYRNEPRVLIGNGVSAFYWLEFGASLLGMTHGHRVKARELVGVMATDQAPAWGRTVHRMWYTGHVHHESVKEFPGCIVESFRTLAAKDAWHHASGYRARRGMVADVWHRTRGKILRHEIGVEELE